MKDAIERLTDAILEKNSRIVAGLDPVLENIPASFYNFSVDLDQGSALLFCYCRDYIRAIKDIAPAIKINSAFFEALHEESLYLKVANFAKEEGLFVIGDLKRADIGSTSAAYAKAFLSSFSPFDAITINPYFGYDGVKPFIEMAAENKKAVFVLVKTSNASSSEIQDLELKDGRKVYEQVANLVKDWGNMTSVNKYGYNCVGAVVGATHPIEAKHLRSLMPETFFLVPGYGAQGATAEDVSVNFDSNGLGAIVNSSRGLMCAYKKYEQFGEEKWNQATTQALLDATNEINTYISRK